MAKYPQNKEDSMLEKIWYKIKSLFGKSDSSEVTKEEERAIMNIYKAEPKVVTVKPKLNKNPQEVVITLSGKNSSIKSVGKKPKKSIKSVREEAKAQSKVSDTTTKVSRSWYNNGKTQKLVPINEVDILTKTWKKGKLPKTPNTKGEK